jgi:excinuclease ABC subunit C
VQAAVAQPEEGEVSVAQPEEGEVSVAQPEEGEVSEAQPEEGDAAVEQPEDAVGVPVGDVVESTTAPQGPAERGARRSDSGATAEVGLVAS